MFRFVVVLNEFEESNHKIVAVVVQLMVALCACTMAFDVRVCFKREIPIARFDRMFKFNADSFLPFFRFDALFIEIVNVSYDSR
jgi:hypothetical protein